MHPTFHLGPIEFPAYFTLLMIAFISAIVYCQRVGARLGMDGRALVDLGIVMLVLGVAGARILAVLTDGALRDFIHLCTDPKLVEAIDAKVRLCKTDAQCGYDYLCDPAARQAVVDGARKTMCYPPRDCLAALEFWQGGLTFYGGLLLAIPGGLWFARRRGLGVARTADLAAPAIMLGLCIGKLGCFAEGCCYGAPTTSWVGVHFPGHAQALHPSQLYESSSALVLFMILHWLIRPRRRRDGQVFAWMLVLYGAVRTGLELFRDDPRGGLGPLSTSQLVSIPLVVVGLWLLARGKGQPVESVVSTE
jgi:phosphatidylglycerol:prolipoprotein diacylglycerol transferase